MAPENLHSQRPATEPPASGMASLMRMLRILFFCFLTLIVGVFLYYFVFSGIFRVDEQFEAMQLRFGVLQRHETDSGVSPILQSGKWYWSFPYPVDEVIMVPANKSISVSTGNTFKAWINPAGVVNSSTGRELRNGVDGYLVSGDMHIFHAEWSVSYRVEDPASYYLNFYDDTKTPSSSVLPSSEQVKRQERLRGHELIIRNLLSDAVLSETASWNTEELIRASRTVAGADGAVSTIRLEDRVRARMERMVEKVQLGIQLQSVNLVGIYQPPAAALQAFNQVNASERNRQVQIQNAQTYANQVQAQASASCDRLVNEARAYQETVVSDLTAQAQYFSSIQAEYAKNPRSTLTVLYANAIRDMLQKVPNKYVLHQTPRGGQQELRLQISQIPDEAPRADEAFQAPSSAQQGAVDASATPSAQ